MPLENHFLEYPHRRHAMDHTRYVWSNLFDREPISLPENKKLGLLIIVPIEFFPLNPSGKPFKAPGSMVTPYPDFRHYTTRDYGNRVGVFRLLKTLKAYGFKANFAVNSEVAARYPILIEEIMSDGHEIVAHGIDMDTLHYGGMDHEQEAIQVHRALDSLRKISGKDIKGWMSPAYSESFHTPDIVKQHGCSYICDWSNDDLPYLMKTNFGDLVAMPVSQEISDRQIIINYHQTENSFLQQIMDQADVFREEANGHGSRILSLTLTPYISGLPFRITTIHQIFEYVGNLGYKSFTGSEIVDSVIAAPQSN